MESVGGAKQISLLLLLQEQEIFASGHRMKETHSYSQETEDSEERKAISSSLPAAKRGLNFKFIRHVLPRDYHYRQSSPGRVSGTAS